VCYNKANKEERQNYFMAKTYKKYEELRFTDDFMFCKILTHNKKLCIKLLELILKQKIKNIKFIAAQKEAKESYDGKGIRMDVYLQNGDTIYDIEMQTVTLKELAKRMRYYQGMIDMESIGAGESYKKLKKTYIIFICTFDFYGAGRHIYTFKNLCKEDTNIEMGDDTSKIVISTKGTMDDVDPEMKQFLEYLDGKTPVTDFTKEIDAKVKEAINQEKWRSDYMTLAMKYREEREAGKAENIVTTVDALMKNTHVQLEDALKMISLTKDDYYEAKEIAEAEEENF